MSSQTFNCCCVTYSISLLLLLILWVLRLLRMLRLVHLLGIIGPERELRQAGVRLGLSAVARWHTLGAGVVAVRGVFNGLAVVGRRGGVPVGSVAVGVALVGGVVVRRRVVVLTLRGPPPCLRLIMLASRR